MNRVVVIFFVVSVFSVCSRSYGNSKNCLEVVIVGQQGILEVSNSDYRYAFRLKDNLLVEASGKSSNTNLIADVTGGGGHWIYVSGSGAKNDAKKLYRQGGKVSTRKASFRIVKVNDNQAVIHFLTIIKDIAIDEEYTFTANSPVVRRNCQLTAMNDIPDLALISWQVKLGESGSETSPYDLFAWGRGAECIIRNENQLTTEGTISDVAVAVDGERPWTATYWLKPDKMKEQFISTFSSKEKQAWTLMFSESQRHPWYFFGDRGENADYSVWFGFRVFGDTIYSSVMPVEMVKKGQTWSTTCWQSIAPAESRNDMAKAYRELLQYEVLSTGVSSTQKQDN